MSPPVYAHLAFVPECHGCSCPCETVEWKLRMRCCPDCFPKMTSQCVARAKMSNPNPNNLDLPLATKHCILLSIPSPCRIGKSPEVVSGLEMSPRKSFRLSRMSFGNQFGRMLIYIEIGNMEKGRPALACEETTGRRICFDYYWLSQSLILETASRSNPAKWAGQTLSR
ncbi:hypothetical protein V8E55_010848 [Tylopilus felleus]